MWTTAGSRKCRKRDAGTGRSGDHLDREGTPLVTNPEVLRGYALLFVIMAVLGAVISLVTGNIAILLFLFIPVTIRIIVLLVLVSLTMQLVTGGGLEIQGIVDAGGVSHQVGANSWRIHRGVSSSVSSPPWEASGEGWSRQGEVSSRSRRKGTRSPGTKSGPSKSTHGTRLIVVRNETGMDPVALYCTEGNSEQVLGIIRMRTSAATVFS